MMFKLDVAAKRGVVLNGVLFGRMKSGLRALFYYC